MLITIEEKTAVHDPANDLLNARDAAALLQNLWQRPFTAKDFGNLRVNAKKQAEAAGKELREFFPIEPVYIDLRSSLWRRSDIEFLARLVSPPKLRESVRGAGVRGTRGKKRKQR